MSTLQRELAETEPQQAAAAELRAAATECTRMHAANAMLSCRAGATLSLTLTLILTLSLTLTLVLTLILTLTLTLTPNPYP